VEEGRPLGRLFVFVWRILSQFDIESQVQRKLDRLFFWMHGIPVILVIREHNAVADHLLTTTVQRHVHLIASRLFDIYEEVKLCPAVRCFKRMIDSIRLAGRLIVFDHFPGVVRELPHEQSNGIGRRGKGPIKDVDLIEIKPGLYLCPGDVLLADYEEGLPAAWTGSFARRQRDYDVMCALSSAVRALGRKCICRSR
jgi:hypothetical protein